MSVGDVRGARRRNLQRYGGASRQRSVSEIVAEERAREQKRRDLAKPAASVKNIKK